MGESILEGKAPLELNLGKVISQPRITPSCELSTLDVFLSPIISCQQRDKELGERNRLLFTWKTQNQACIYYA